MEKFYCLYSTPDAKVGTILCTAENIDEVIEESKYHTEGFWFEYDVENEYHLLNERRFEYDQFPEVAEDREREEIKADGRFQTTGSIGF